MLNESNSTCLNYNIQRKGSFMNTKFWINRKDVGNDV